MARIDRFLGLRNTASPERFDDGDLDVALNVDLDDDGKLSRRKGLELRVAGSYHSAWSDGDACFVASGTTLYAVDHTFALTAVATGLTAGREFAYERINGVTYWSNGAECGLVRDSGNRSWGLVPPSAAPNASAIAGMLKAGRYLYTVAYERSDLQESGAPLPMLLTLASDGGGISFTNIPVSTDPTVAYKWLYLSARNGDTCYRAFRVANSITSALFQGADTELQVPLNRYGYQGAPAGQIIQYYAGRMWIAQANVIWYSDEYNYELFDQRLNFIQFSSPVRVMCAVQDGMFVATDEETIFMSGSTGMVRVQKAAYGAIARTQARVEQDHVSESAGRSWMWMSTRGVCFGGDGGQFANLTEKRYSIPPAETGAGMIRRSNGFQQYLCALRGSGRADNQHDRLGGIASISLPVRSVSVLVWQVQANVPLRTVSAN